MYTAPNLSTSPTTDPPQPAPLSSGEVRTILWRARGGFAEAWSWRLEGWAGYRPLLHAVALLLCLASLAGCVAEARAEEEHRHSCHAISDVPTVGSCCRLRENGSCTLWGKMACTARGCDCGATCAPSCTACMGEE